MGRDQDPDPDPDPDLGPDPDPDADADSWRPYLLPVVVVAVVPTVLASLIPYTTIITLDILHILVYMDSKEL